MWKNKASSEEISLYRIIWASAFNRTSFPWPLFLSFVLPNCNCIYRWSLLSCRARNQDIFLVISLHSMSNTKSQNISCCWAVLTEILDCQYGETQRQWRTVKTISSVYWIGKWPLVEQVTSNEDVDLERGRVNDSPYLRKSWKAWIWKQDYHSTVTLERFINRLRNQSQHITTAWFTYWHFSIYVNTADQQLIFWLFLLDTESNKMAEKSLDFSHDKTKDSIVW